MSSDKCDTWTTSLDRNNKTEKDYLCLLMRRGTDIFTVCSRAAPNNRDAGAADYSSVMEAATSSCMRFGVITRENDWKINGPYVHSDAYEGAKTKFEGRK